MRRLGVTCGITLLCGLLLYSYVYATRAKAALVPDSYVGIWSGTDGEQATPPLSFTMRFGIGQGSTDHVVGTVEYPSLACGGTITLGSATADSIELAETVTYGSCHENGLITLSTTGDDSLTFEWRTVSASITATGTLTRTSVSAGAIAPNYLGVWDGQGGPQGEGYTILTALVPAENNSVAATIIYPSLACGGTWTLQSTTPISISLFEDIDYGSCVDNGAITLTPQVDGSLHFEWRQGSYAETGRLTLIGGLRVFLPLIQH